MEVMFLVSRVESSSLLRAFLRACVRGQVDYCCFLTGPAAALALDPDIGALLKTATRSAVCEHSWERFGSGECLVPLGSQTENSALTATTHHIVSL
ncbi:MAG TPA: hypothetical protein VMV40_05515 [Acidiferrobacter sp.]|nr:hypothetical protein [Acidiferrobacter sp.]